MFRLWLSDRLVGSEKSTKASIRPIVSAIIARDIFFLCFSLKEVDVVLYRVDQGLNLFNPIQIPTLSIPPLGNRLKTG